MLTRDQATAAFQRLLRAVYYLDSRNILHRDIKLSNMLLKEAGDFSTTVLGDFGLAIDLNTEKPVYGQQVGTAVYFSPELDDKRGVTSKQSDIWACGVAYYRMLTGGYPSKGRDMCVNYSNMQYDDERVIRQCLHWDRNARPSAARLLDDLDWVPDGRHQK